MADIPVAFHVETNFGVLVIHNMYDQHAPTCSVYQKFLEESNGDTDGNKG